MKESMTISPSQIIIDFTCLWSRYKKNVETIETQLKFSFTFLIPLMQE